MKKNIFLCLVSILACMLFVLPSCLDDIEFDRPATIENGIAIQGKLVKGDPSFIRVTLRRIFDFSENARLINARSVILSDEEGNSIELDSRQEGVFFEEIPPDNPDIQIEFGKSYKIRVETFDGRTYESSLDRLLPVPTPRDLRVEMVTKEGLDALGRIVDREFIAFSLDTPLRLSEAEENVKLLWELEATYRLSDTPELYTNRNCFPTRVNNVDNKTCYVTSSPITNFIPVDGETINSSSLDNFTLYETIPSSLFAEGYFLTVLQQSVSIPAFEYWSQVNQVLSRTGDLFEPPVGKVTTNFVNVNDPNDDVFGYFYATEEKPIRIFVSPEFAGNVATSCPAPLTEDGRADNTCCDCLTAGDTSTERPIWWVE